MQEFVSRLAEKVARNYAIERKYYEQFDVKRGLRNADGSGVLAGLTRISSVTGFVKKDGQPAPVEGELRYRGINIREIVEKLAREKRHGFEEIVYLLLSGELPGEKEAQEFHRALSEQSGLPDGFVENVILPFNSSNIMNSLQRVVLALYAVDAKADDISISNVLRQCVGLIAKFPAIIAYSYQASRYRHQGGTLVIRPPKPEYDPAENFLYMLRADGNFSPLEAELLDLALVLHAEHGGGNNSAFTMHVLTSSHTDTYSAVSGSIASLKGPLHGAANAYVMDMMAHIKSNVKDWENEKEVSAFLEKILRKKAFDRKGLVYGMGHAVYTLSDPRAVILKNKARELAEVKHRMDEFRLYQLVESLTPDLFRKIKNSEKTISANVDFYSGFVYDMLGFPKEIYPSIFAMARVSGWSAHRLEELINGNRIIRPSYKSIAENRDVTGA